MSSADSRGGPPAGGSGDPAAGGSGGPPAGSRGGPALVGFLGDLLEDVVVQPCRDVREATDTPCVISRRRGGSAAGAAVAAAGVLGPGRVRFFGQVGADATGETLVGELAAAGVEPCVRRGGRTGTVVVLLDDAGERTMLTDRGACPDLAGYDAAWLAGLGILHVAGYSLLADPLATVARRMIHEVRSRGGEICVDTCSVGAVADAGVGGFTDTLAAVRADVLLCDAGEAAMLCDAAGSDGPGGLGDLAGLVIVKDGPRHTRLYGQGFDGEALAPPPLRHVPDVTGAGDAFAGGLLAARLDGSDWREATVAGQATAAARLRSLGATP